MSDDQPKQATLLVSMCEHHSMVQINELPQLNSQCPYCMMRRIEELSRDIKERDDRISVLVGKINEEDREKTAEYADRIQRGENAASVIVEAVASANAHYNFRCELQEESEKRVCELEAQVERLAYATRTRPDYDFRCQRCGAPHNLDTSIPSDAWNTIAERTPGKDDKYGALCTVCIDELLTEKGLTAEAEFYYVGKSLLSRSYDGLGTVQWSKILKMIRDYQTERRTHSCATSPVDLVKSLINDCRSTETNAFQGMKSFRDDVLVWLKVFQHLVEGVHRGATHRSKEIRAEMLLEEIASAAEKLRKVEFDFHRCYRWWDDVFATDYPTRQFVKRIHELEDELKELRAVPSAQEPNSEAD